MAQRHDPDQQRLPKPSDCPPGETVIWWKRLPGGDYVFPGPRPRARDDGKARQRGSR